MTTAIAACLAASGCGGGDKDLHAFRVPSPSMVPTFKIGDIVQADFAAYKKAAPKRGDIVLFNPPGGADSAECGKPAEPTDGHPCERAVQQRATEIKVIKRVVGLPGEWLYFRDNRTYVGKRRGGPFERADESFVKTSPCGELCNLRKPIQVPSDTFYVLGDNRGESDDSRHFGPVPRAWVLGKVLHKAD